MGNENNTATAPATAELEKLHDDLISSLEKYQPENVTDQVKELTGKLTAYKAERVKFQSAKAAYDKAQGELNAPPKEYDLKLGDDSPLGKDYAETVKAYAREHKLTQAQAASILNERDAAARHLIERKNADFQKTIQAKKAALEAHKVLGGANAARTNEMVTRFFETFGSPEAKDATGKVTKVSTLTAFQQMGGNVDSEWVEMFYKAATALGPEKLKLPKLAPQAQPKGQIPGHRPPKGFSVPGSLTEQARAKTAANT